MLDEQYAEVWTNFKLTLGQNRVKRNRPLLSPPFLEKWEKKYSLFLNECRVGYMCLSEHRRLFWKCVQFCPLSDYPPTLR